MHRWIRATLVGMGLLLGAQPAVAVNYVYILTGQSNSLGAVKGSPATAEQLARYASEGLLWSGNMVRDTGKPFDASPSWKKVQPQLPEYNGSLCMGPEYGFAHIMQRHGWHTAGRDCVCVIKASLDGGGNTFWTPGKPAYITLSNTVKNGLAALQGQTRVSALLYLQGESDKGEEISRAPVRFAELKARLQKEVKKGLKYAVVGECATWHGKDAKDASGNTTAQLMHAFSQKKKDIGWVRTRDLTKITSGDSMGVHYDGISQISIGARYAYAVALLEKLPLGFVRGDAPQAPLDSAAAWWGNKVPKEGDVISWDVSSCRGAESLHKNMAVGGLVVEDPVAGVVEIAASAGCELQVGAQGIELKEGDLTLHLPLVTAEAQTWTLAGGRTLKLKALKGKGTITLQAPEDAALELELEKAPLQSWVLPEKCPQVKATIGGKPAHFVKRNEVYKLEPQS